MIKSDYGIGILGTGHELASYIETNEELCRTLPNTSPEWILEKTGIKRRYLARPGDSASDFCVAAAHRALDKAKIKAQDLGLIIVCTFSADYIFPPVSAKVQKELGAGQAQIFDVQANCSGFITGLTCASDRMLVDDSVKYALVVGVELHTRFIDRKDVNTAIYFSDGAGGAVLGRVPFGFGIQSSAFFTDSSNYEAVRFRGGGSSFPLSGRELSPEIDFIEMNGLATWKQAITHLPPTIRRACDKANLSPADIDLFLFHQANLNLIQYVVRKMGQPLEKTCTNVEEIGNTGAASVGIILDEAATKGKIRPGQILLLAGVGAGFNFGASIWKWHEEASGA